MISKAETAIIKVMITVTRTGTVIIRVSVTMTI